MKKTMFQQDTLKKILLLYQSRYNAFIDHQIESLTYLHYHLKLDLFLYVEEIKPPLLNH